MTSKVSTTPLVAHTSAGERISVNEGSLIKNLGAIASKVKGRGPICFRTQVTKADNEEFLAAYSDNRTESPGRVKEYCDRMNAHQWVIDYPTWMWSSYGIPVNGRHTSLAFQGSNLDVLTVNCILGVDHAITTHIDTNKTRNLVDQGHYLHIYEDIESNDDRVSFMAATSWVFGLMCQFRQIVPDTSLSQGKKHICHYPKGIALLHQARPLFIQCRDDLQDSETTTFMKAQFYVPSLILSLTGNKTYQKWVDKLVAGDGMERGDLLLHCRNYVMSLCNHTSASHRDTHELMRSFVGVLSFLYAKATNTVAVGVLPRLKVAIKDDPKHSVRKGDIIRIKYSSAQLRADQEHQQVVMRYFLEQIPV